MDQHTETGIIQPKIYYYHNRSILWDGGSYFNKVLGIAYTSGHGKVPEEKHNIIKQVDWVTGCAFFARNSVLREVGLLPRNFFIYYEDVDLSLRIRKAGYSLIYHPDSVIYHIAGVSNKKKIKGKEGFVNPIVHYLNIRNRIWVLKKHTPFICIPTVSLYSFFYIIAIMGYFVARLRFNKFKQVCKAVKDGLAGHVKY
jgi:GT2 family glycosyltransferase